MIKGHKDATAERALSSVNREWKHMANLAVMIRDGRSNPAWAEEQSKKFTGIFRRLLEDPIEDVRTEANSRRL